MKTTVAVLLVVAATLCPVLSRAGKNVDVTVMPGESRVISHSVSASRDTALMGYQVLPRVVLSCGADFSFLGLRFKGLDLRFGMFGMVEVQTTTEQPTAFLYIPSGPYTWRGLLGYSIALSLDDLSKKWLGPGSALEAAISFRHESEHWTGGYEETDAELRARFYDTPNIGDFIMPDLAIRTPAGKLDIEFRTQVKLFLPTYDTYSVGPGVDLIFRWRLHRIVHPFASFFAEYLFGKTHEVDGETVPVEDNYLARGLLGLIFPGDVADIQIFMAFDRGKDKGVLVDMDEYRFGWGLRIGLFKQSRKPVGNN